MTVQTQSQRTHDMRLAARKGLLPVRGGGWLGGFGNMLNKELGEWFRTRRWLWQILIWVIALDGFIAFVLFILPVVATIMPQLKATAEGVFSGQPQDIGSASFFFTFLMMAGVIGVIILAQDEIIQEKMSGTAAWILSKPAARTAFILTKLLSNIIGVLVFIITIPALVLFGMVFLKTGQVLPLVPFMAGTGVIMIGLYFYLSLAIMLGVLSESRGSVLGISFGIMLGGMVLRNIIPYLLYVLPYGMEAIALGVMLGTPLPAMLVSELVSTIILSIVFTLVALWRFQKIEL